MDSASIENGESSVRGMVEFNERTIFSLDEQYADIDKLFQLEKHILKIQLILQFDSEFNQLVKNRKSSFNELVNGVIQDLQESKIEVVISGSELLNQDSIIMIPKLYAEKLIRKELVTNIKNHSLRDVNSKVYIDFTKEENAKINVKITNKKAKVGYNKSNLEGIKCLKLMASSNLFSFDYTTNSVSDDFIQMLTFK